MTLIPFCGFSCTNHNTLLVQSSMENGFSRTKVAVGSSTGNSGHFDGETEKFSGVLKRRSVLISGFSLLSSAVAGFPSEGLAVVKQGLLPGRVPGLSEPNEEGWFPYSSYYFSSVSISFS